jgi:hypothetical protein
VKQTVLGFALPELREGMIATSFRSADKRVFIQGSRAVLCAFARSVLAIVGERSPRPPRALLKQRRIDYERTWAALQAGGITRRDACAKYGVKYKAFSAWLGRRNERG